MFTPGPWSIDPDGLEMPSKASIDAPSHGELALVVWKMDDDERSPEKEANAYLIAAAPDLYAALEVLLEDSVQLANSGDCGNWDPETQAPIIAARAALAKARGEA
jgi:hypothetical protein